MNWRVGDLKSSDDLGRSQKVTGIREKKHHEVSMYTSVMKSLYMDLHTTKTHQ